MKNKNSQNGNFFNKYLKEFIKTDVEYTYTINHPKSAIVFRAFAGVGIPISKSDTTLPFFKQYFGGGPNSMRGWPVRGIGVGGQSWRHINLMVYLMTAPAIYNWKEILNTVLMWLLCFPMQYFLKWHFLLMLAIFGILKIPKPDGSTDTTQFKFENLYKQLGVSSGVGFRFDFNYFLLRFDVGFRFKRPDVIKE